MCQKLKRFLLSLALLLLFSLVVSAQATQLSAAEYENVDLTEFLGLNPDLLSSDPTMSSSSKQTSELKLEIPSLSNMPILWPEASSESEQSLTAQQLNSMDTTELWSLLDNQLGSLDNTLAQLEQSVASSKKETESLKKSIEDIKKEKEAAEKVIEHLKATLASNKEDQALVNSLLGEQLMKIEQLEKDAAETKKYVAFLELQEKRLKRNGVAVPVCAAVTLAGGFMFGYGLAKDNMTMAFIGLGIAVAPTIVWSGGHWCFKWW